MDFNDVEKLAGQINEILVIYCNSTFKNPPKKTFISIFRSWRCLETPMGNSQLYLRLGAVFAIFVTPRED